jgi:putative adenylate-forming enzyme
MSTATAPSNETGMATLQAQGAELVARDRWPRPRLLAFQRERLQALLAHAVSTSPYYREALGPDAGTGCVSLEELPTLPKAALIDEFDRIVTDPRLRLVDLERHLAGPNPGSLVLDTYHVFSTSGTSGLRGLIVYSEEEFRSWVAVSLRLFARAGITPETRLVAIGAPNPLHITRQLFAAFRSGRTGTPRLSVLTPLEEIVPALNEYRPEALLTYASLAALLAQEQLDGRLRIEPRIVGVSSEVLTEEARRWIDEAWGVRSTEVYATTETLYIAASTPPHPGLHLFEDLAVVEVVDERNQPVPPGTPGFKVLVTNLVNRTQPLIRYELSDSVVLADGPDPSGLPYRRIARVDGRSDDILHFAGAGGGEIRVHPYRLREPFAALSDVRQYQVVHDDEGLLVRVVLKPSAPRDTPGRVRAAVLEALEAAGALAPPLDIQPVETIERESGHAAKFKLIKALASRPTL